MNHFPEPTNAEKARGQSGRVQGRAFSSAETKQSQTKNISHQTAETMESHVISAAESSWPLMTERKKERKEKRTETGKYCFRGLYLKMLYKISLFDVEGLGKSSSPFPSFYK